MILKRFVINCSLRAILIAATLCLTAFLFLQTSYFLAGSICGVVAVVQFIALLHYVTLTNRSVSQLLASIEYSDLSQSFPQSPKGFGFDDLARALNEVINKFRRMNLEKEEQFRFLQTIVDHVGIGLLAYRDDGAVELHNNAAKRLLNVPVLRNIDDLSGIDPMLLEALQRISPGENRLVKLQRDGDLLQLSIYATGFVSNRRQLQLVAMQDIQNELEEKEMMAWQNLIRVLTHEIMNSIAPIASLASTANGLLAKDCMVGPGGHRSEHIKDVCDAVETIEKRSKGLIAFIEKYRELTRIPQPQFQIVEVADLVERVKSLMAEQMDRRFIQFKTRVDPKTLEITADPALIEQVLINLCKNAMEAMSAAEQPLIELTAGTDGQGNPVIKVADNGRGIPDDVAERIFIPFFTTKRGGSGIGLSLSRQIMRLHKGSLNVDSQPGLKTVFALRF